MENKSPYKCQKCSCDTRYLCTEEQVDIISDKINQYGNLENSEISEVPIRLKSAYLLPIFAPKGMIKCIECKHVQIITYGMLGKLLFRVEALPQSQTIRKMNMRP